MTNLFENMLEPFFKERSLLLKNVKIALLILLLINGVLSIVSLLIIFGHNEYANTYLGMDLPANETTNSKQVNEMLGKKIFKMLVNYFILFTIDAVLKTIVEEVALMLMLEFFGFFSILFSNVYLVLVYASAYLMPNILITLSLSFASSLNVMFLILHGLKVVCALESYHFACLAKCESDLPCNSKKKTQSSFKSTIAGSSAPSAL